MRTNISEFIGAKLRQIAGTIDGVQSIPVYGETIAKIYRADGRIEEKVFKNTLTSAGLNRLAFRGTTYTNTVAQYLAIGTQTAAASLGSTQAGIGEVSRKIQATIVQSQDWIALTASWGGASDTMTGLVLSTVAIADHASSGSGILFAISNSLNTTLAASDTLLVTHRIRVGSHNLGQST